MQKLIHNFFSHKWDEPQWLKNWCESENLGHVQEPRSYLIEIKHPEVLIILEPDDEKKRKLLYFRLPIKYVQSINTKVLKILWHHNLITHKQATHAFQKWVSEESQIYLEYSDYRGLCRETIVIPVRRRGNEHYHDYTWSRIQWYQMVFDSLPFIYKETEQRRINIIKKPQTKKINYCNTLMITLTYDPKLEKSVPAFWDRTSPDTNKYFTNLKNRLKHRNLDMLFYFKALESGRKGYPHIHIVCKLKNPVPCYKYWSRKHKKTVLRPFNKKLFHWNHGLYDVTGISHSNGIKYITKYITKTTNNNEHGLTKHHAKTLSLSWISKKRLYSNSQFCLFKHKFPALHKFMTTNHYSSGLNLVFDEKSSLTKRCTANVLVDLHWNGVKFPRIPWESSPELRKRFRLPQRLLANRASEIWARPPLETRLNYEGFYQVIGIRCLKNNSTSVFLELKTKKTQGKPPPERFTNKNKLSKVKTK